MLKKLALALLLMIGIGMTIMPKEAEAGSYYYDTKTGQYVVNVTGATYTGKDLNMALPGSTVRQMKNAAVNKYGSISTKYTYTFNYKNIVTPYGKYGGSTWSGRITGVTCTGRR